MCQTACPSADFSFHGLIQNETVLSFASIIYVTSLCCHSISLFLFHLSNSPLYVVILFSLFKFYLFFRLFILPLYFAILFCHCISPCYFARFSSPSILISLSSFALLFYFAILFRPLFYFAIFFHPLFYFAILFALLFCLFLFIFSNANSFLNFYIGS